MRKRVLERLRRCLQSRLAADWPEARALDRDNVAFNGVFGFSLLQDKRGSLFLTVLPHDESDRFRVEVAWASGAAFPEGVARDLAMDTDQVLALPSGTLPLGELSAGCFPDDCWLDPNGAQRELRMLAILQRAAAGEAVDPLEWIEQVVGISACAIDEAIAYVEPACEALASTLCASVGRIACVATALGGRA